MNCQVTDSTQNANSDVLQRSWRKRKCTTCRGCFIQSEPPSNPDPSDINEGRCSTKLWQCAFSLSWTSSLSACLTVQISTTTCQMVIFCVDSHGPQRRTPNDFSFSFTVGSAPPSGQNFLPTHTFKIRNDTLEYLNLTAEFSWNVLQSFWEFDLSFVILRQ